VREEWQVLEVKAERREVREGQEGERRAEVGCHPNNYIKTIVYSRL
jgi:hypothetical protein